MTTEHPWTRRVSALAFWLGIAIVVVALAGTTLARFDVIGKMPGFLSFVYSAMAGGGVAVLGVVALIMNWRNNWPALGKAALAIVIGVAAFGGLSHIRSTAADYPFIHDVTTDLDNPPEFVELTIPEDNLRGVETVEAWKEAHAEGYSDLTGITVSASPAEVVAKAEELAKERGWTIEAVAPEEGRFEAVAYASWIKFEDIVVLRAVPMENGETLVDMRSISRVGISDLGENAKRIREFLGALQES